MNICFFSPFQADFATSAVDFLHRIGRTGRAGQHGLVTSLYTKANRDLVSAVRRAENLSQPVVIVKLTTAHSLIIPLSFSNSEHLESRYNLT